MAIPPPRPTAAECRINASTTSIGASPVAVAAVVPSAGYITRVIAAAGGTTTGTITVAVAINNGSDIANSTLTIAAGSNPRAGTVVEIPLNGAGTTSGVFVNEGDCIVFTPSGGGGATIPGAFSAVVRSL